MITETLPSPTAAASSSTFLKKQLFESLKTSDDYRYAFVEERIQTGLAAQVHAIRKQRGMDPKQFAEKLGKKVSWVYRLEDPNQPPPTITSLIDVARAYDCDLEVRFRPFSETLDEMDSLSPDSLSVTSFKDEAPEIEEILSHSWAFDSSIKAIRQYGLTTQYLWGQALAEHAAAPAPLESYYWGEVAPAFQPDTASLEVFNVASESIGSLDKGTPNPAAAGVATLKPNWGNVISIEEFRGQPRRRFAHKRSGYGRSNRERRASA